MIAFILLCTLLNGVKAELENCKIKLRVVHSCNSSKFMEYCVEDGINAFTSEFYNKDNCNTVLLSLPFYNDIEHYNIKPMIDALTSRCEFNIVVLDNSATTNTKLFLSYGAVIPKVYEDMKQYAKVVNEALALGLVSGKCLKAVGFSMGAQQVGQLCRMLDQKCCHILAIDPAGPNYLDKELSCLPHHQLVSKSDACHVVFVECNRWIMGTGFHSGHDNIIVNGGTFQPGCMKLNVLCSHEFGNKLVYDAIRNPGTCLSTSEKNGGISSNSTKGKDYFDLILPLNSSSCENCNSDEESKDLYLKSSSSGPFCIGRDTNL